MKYRLFLIGLFFLINPYIWVIDILPDFIGLLIMLKAIKPLIDISPSAEEAAKGFRKAAAVSVAQIGFLIPMISVVNNDATFNMIFSFSFNILRLIFLIPAFGHLFNAFIYFSERHAVKGRGASVKRLKTVKLICQAYVIIHCALSAFPEIVYFRMDDSGFAEMLYPLSYFRSGAIFLTGAIALIFTVAWYVINCCQFSALRKNAELNQGISSDIANTPRSEKKRIMRSAAPAVMCYILSLFAIISYFIDGQCVIPPYVAPILHIMAISYLNKIVDKKITKAFSIVATIVAFPLHLFYAVFSTTYHERALFAFDMVEKQFSLPLWNNIIYTSFLVISLICTGVSMLRLIKQHTGLFWESAYITHNSKAAREKLLCEELSAALTVVSCLAAAFNTFAYSVLYTKPLFNLFALIFGTAVAVCGALLYSSVKSSIIEKYSTENKMN